MSDAVERSIGDLTVSIDRSRCVGFAQCVDESAQAFQLHDDEKVAFVVPEQVTREDLLRACGACPVEALLVVDRDGRQLVP
jgi:ferredoxin